MKIEVELSTKDLLGLPVFLPDFLILLPSLGT